MYKEQIRVLALSWRDIKAPKSGGAEVHTHEMLRRLNQNKFDVIHFSPMFEGSYAEEVIDNIKYLRRGNFVTVIFWAWLYYIKNHAEIDFVIEQCNTHRFFTKFWVPLRKRIFYIHQLTREIWEINLKFPWGKIGKTLETWMLWLNRKDITITVSESTKKELIEIGFNADRIYIIPNGINEEMYMFIDKKLEKEQNPTYIYAGRYSKYKGIDVCIEALAQIKEIYPKAKLWILGKKDERFISEEIEPLCSRLHIKCGNAQEHTDNDVIMWGFVSEEKKYELMKRAHVLLFPSQREGWGIIVTEAAVLGTPSIVYNAPGTVDAVDFGRAGYLCEEKNADGVAQKMRQALENANEYKQIVENARKFSNQFRWENNGKMLQDILEKYVESN